MEISKNNLITALKEKKCSFSDLSEEEKYLLIKKPVFNHKGRMVLKGYHKNYCKRLDSFTYGEQNQKTMLSKIIPSFNDQTYFGTLGRQEKGYYQQEKLKAFQNYKGFNSLQNFIKNLDNNQSVIVYMPYHHDTRHLLVHGFIMTDLNAFFLDKIIVSNTYKTKYLLSEIEEYISIRGN